LVFLRTKRIKPKKRVLTYSSGDTSGNLALDGPKATASDSFNALLIALALLPRLLLIGCRFKVSVFGFSIVGRTQLIAYKKKLNSMVQD